MIFDTHCHLNSPELFKDIDLRIEEAFKVGVRKFVVVGWDKKSSLLAISIAEKYPFIYAAIGFHPTEVFNVSKEDYDELFSYLNHPKVVAVGEIGLDYHWIKENDKREIQKKWFIKQIETANQFNKPIIIHNRDSISDCLEILKEHKPIKGGIMHCYSGSVESMKEFISLGLLIGIGGPVTFLNAKAPKEVVKGIPLNKLVFETDCPYLAPHPLRGTINIPKNIALVLDEVARLREESKRHIEEATFTNACQMFHV